MPRVPVQSCVLPNQIPNFAGMGMVMRPTTRRAGAPESVQVANSSDGRLDLWLSLRLFV